MMKGNLIVEKIHETEFNLIKNEWNRLLVCSISNNVFLTWEWIHTWWKSFGKQKDLCIITARNNRELVGIAPFYIQKINKLLGVNSLKICSSEELYPDYLDVIARQGHEREVTLALFHYLAERVGGWNVMSFDNLLPESNIMRYEKYFNRKYLRQVTLSSICPYIRIEEPYEIYKRRQFKRKKRYNLERQMRFAVEENKLKYVTVESKDLLPLAMEQLFLLHQKRAKNKKIASAFTSQDVESFHLEFSRLLLENAGLRLCLLFDGKKPISAIYAFKYNNKFLFYQSGMDPEWGKMSIGTVLLNILIKQAFDEKLTEFDFLKGDEDYKNTWSNSERKQLKLTLYKKDPPGTLLFMNNLLRSYAKKIYSRFP